VSSGIVSWGVHLPFWRLQRSAIGSTLGSPAGRGSRTAASHDEDTTTMGVEAARRALAALAALDGDRPEELLFSTPAPAYLDKTNATAIYAALGLSEFGGAYDLIGSVRSGIGALRSAAALADGRRTMAVLSDLRTGFAGSPDEREGGDGAVAFVFGDEGAVGEVIASVSTSGEFLDRWRVPGETRSRQWEERFGQEAYTPLIEAAFTEALKSAAVTADELDHVVVAGLHQRAVKAATLSFGVRSEAMAPDLTLRIGNLGAAHVGVALAEVLDRAEPGELIAVALLADGADVMILRVTPALLTARTARQEVGAPTVAELIAAGRDDLPYARFLTWRGELKREPPRRPDPERPGAPATWRSTSWKSGFNASRCTACGFRHLPPTRICLRCKAIDQMEKERLADRQGQVATFTIDHLAFSMSPPLVGVVVDFDGGGRYRCELTDVDPADVAIGMRVEMTFRRIWTAQGVHNYFWKARPVAAVTAHGDAE